MSKTNSFSLILLSVFVYAFQVQASNLRSYSSSEVFKPNYRVYQDLNENILIINGRNVLTDQLSKIHLRSMDRITTNGQSKVYLGVEATVPGGKRQIVWVNSVGTTSSIQRFLEGLKTAKEVENQKESFSWGDPLLTEAYLKNKHLRQGWFDSVRHFFDMNSTLAKQIIAGVALPRDLHEDKSYYFVVDDKNPVAILTKDGVETGKYLDVATIVTVELQKKHYFDSQKNGYSTNDASIVSTLVKFKTVPNFFGDSKIEGHLRIDSLLQAIQPIENLKELSEQYEKLIPALRQRYEGEDGALTIDRALRQFHNSICTASGSGRDALLKKWEVFVASKKDKRAQQVARNAQHVDIVARTIIGEAQNEGHLFDPRKIQNLTKEIFHPHAVSCQRDIIALSIRNRAQTKRFKEFGHRYLGDFTGAASTDSQYNAWFPHLVGHMNHRITSCFYSENTEYFNLRKRSDRSYMVYKSRYDSMVKRLPVVLGMSKDEGRLAESDPEYLDHHFEANPDQFLNRASNVKILSSYRNYYHPNNGGLKVGDASEALNEYRYGEVKSGYVRVVQQAMTPNALATYYPVINGRLTQFNEGDAPKTFAIRLKERFVERGVHTDFRNDIRMAVHTFEMYVNNRWMNPDDYFKGRTHILEFGLKAEPIAANELWALFPNALFPQCFEKDGYISPDALKKGVRIPIHWFSKEIRNSAAASLNQLLAGDNQALSSFMGGALYEVDRKKTSKGRNLYTDHGQPVTIRCIEDTYYSEAHDGFNDGYPQFGGYCDPNIMLVEGM